MSREQTEALASAQRWCAERTAEVQWSHDESRCSIRVASPSAGGWVEGEGAGYYECRVRFDAQAAPDGPPSNF